MNYKFIFSIAVLSILITSCFKEDEMVEPHKSGENIIDNVNIGSDYSEQIFYDLYTDEIISTNHIEDWDLAFDSGDDNWMIHLNSSRWMHAANTKLTDFNLVTTSDGWNYAIDNSNGHPDSTAIMDWYEIANDSVISKDYVYVIDLGQNANFQAMGYLKIQIYTDKNKYIIKSAKLNGDNLQFDTIIKSENYNKAYLSFQNGQIDIAPEKDLWTLNFTKYTDVLATSEGDLQEYLVAGVLINRNNCKVAIDNTIDFDEITLSDTSNYEYSNELDVIGYEWKYYDFDNSAYTIVPDLVYIIKDHNGIFYKLRFIDFYDENGIKGSPKFEFVKL